jgi:pimeloyl-ACP methyl ester carboxylesterase
MTKYKASHIDQKFITVNGVKISFFKYGNGPKKILILHGFGSSIKSWKKLIVKFDPKQYTLYFPELPGFGQSQHPPKPWQVKNYTSFINDLLKSQKITPEFLVCHSFGGRISIQLLTQKNNFQKAIFIAAAGIRPELNLIQKLANKIGPILNPIKKFKPIQSLLKFVRKIIGAGDYNQVQGTMKQTFINVVNTDLTKKLSHIKTPVQLIWGDKDTLTPLYMGQIMDEQIPNSNLKIYTNKKHGLHLTCPSRLHKDILSFIN